MPWIFHAISQTPLHQCCRMRQLHRTRKLLGILKCVLKLYEQCNGLILSGRVLESGISVTTAPVVSFSFFSNQSKLRRLPCPRLQEFRSVQIIVLSSTGQPRQIFQNLQFGLIFSKGSLIFNENFWNSG